MDNIETYAPYVVIISIFFIQNKIFATPADLEKIKSEIYKELSDKYVKQTEFSEIKEKIDKIYDYLIIQNEKD